jgi:hypothetical protein
MSTNWMTCPMCGCLFDPDEHVACQSCPLHKNCHLVCCPNCGYNSIDPGRSSLAQAAIRWLHLGSINKMNAGDQVGQRSTKE